MGTSVDDWLCFCHSNVIVVSSFNSRMDVMNGTDGS